jgi:hypothetical protein
VASIKKQNSEILFINPPFMLRNLRFGILCESRNHGAKIPELWPATHLFLEGKRTARPKNGRPLQNPPPNRAAGFVAAIPFTVNRPVPFGTEWASSRSNGFAPELLFR